MMLEKLQALEKHFEELHESMADPAVTSDPARLREITREISDLEETVAKYRAYKTTHEALEKTQAMVREETDEDLRAMAREEAEKLQADEGHLLQELRLALLPKDIRDDKDVFIEIRGGTGGDEAALFAADLYRMY